MPSLLDDGIGDREISVGETSVPYISPDGLDFPDGHARA